jgi:hypothetical protein
MIRLYQVLGCRYWRDVFMLDILLSVDDVIDGSKPIIAEERHRLVEM